MDQLPAHFRQDPSQWKDISSFMRNRQKNDTKAHYKAYQDFLHMIHDAPETGEHQKTMALELLNTITLPDFHIKSRLLQQQAVKKAAEHAKEIVRENSFVRAAALIIHAEDEIFKDITEQQPEAANQQVKGVVRKRIRTEESSSMFCEPWGSLMKIMHEVLRHGRSDTSVPSGDTLSETCKALYTYICAYLEDNKTALQHEKDLLVALSGIINLRTHDTADMFGRRLINDIEESAPQARPDGSIADILQLLKNILVNHDIQYLRDEISILDAKRVHKVRRGEHVEPSLKIVLDVIRFLADKIIAGNFGDSEHAVVSTWKGVLDIISGGLLNFEAGELTSDATKEIRVLQEQEFSGTSKSVCGRKLDLQLLFDGMELNNSEFKAVGVDVEENKKQSRKNIRINKAIMVYLQRHAKFDFQDGNYLVFLYVSGYTGTIVYLRRYKDIHVSGLLSRMAIKLPFDEKGMKTFLDGQSLGWLLTYVQHLCSMQEEVEDAQIQATDNSFLQEERITPPSTPRMLDVIVMNTPKKKGPVVASTQLYQSGRTASNASTSSTGKSVARQESALDN
ncbi:hypothetical protein BGZ51_008042 [Haplosporangium sp. Z 767]|nr:hypothetical protein BGZ50_008163 [Haplosporangium sp. Z 11]KAF9178171.1 hypothetical protein BGZ51_008042 [Haplosporangium sp. Z 767]